MKYHVTPVEFRKKLYTFVKLVITIVLLQPKMCCDKRSFYAKSHHLICSIGTKRFKKKLCPQF